MGTYSAAVSVHKTLVSTTIDTITLTSARPYIEVANETGSSNLYVTAAVGQAGAPADPVVDASDTGIVYPGTTLEFRLTDAQYNNGAVVKILGNGNKYSVTGVNP